MVTILFLWSASAQAGITDVVNIDNAKKLVDGISGIASLGTVGIIAAIVLALLMIGVYVWWHFKGKAATHRKNEEQRAKDNASTKPVNQGITDEWDEASDRVNDKRKDGEAGTKPRPPEPGE